jgi:D-3-phosphoglycerate dehydrogenase
MKIHFLNNTDYSSRALSVYEEIKQKGQGSILITRLEPVTKEIIDSMPNLKIIGSSTTGTNHIDMAYAQKKSIKVITLNDCRDKIGQISATAEHTFALMLVLVRNVVKAHNDVVTTVQHREVYKGIELQGKTLGIIGMGRIGKMMVKYAYAFGMNILPFDKDSELTLEAVIARSDIVSIHLPLNEDTKGMINSAHFNSMKPGAFLINTARGEIITKGSLHSALYDGKIAGAAIDVMHGEWDQDLVDYAKEHDNLIITPHIAGATTESMEKAEFFLAETIKEYVDNQYVVNS